MDCSDGCPTAAVMFGVPGVRVLTAERDAGGLRLTVETDQQVEGCHGCGVLAVPHGRREHLLHDAPFGHRRVRVAWRKRVWRCLEPACAMRTFTETHALAPPRALLTRRAVVWAADALTDDDTTVAALARRLDVDWHTLWDALKVEARRRADHPDRLTGVESLGVDEHIWRPGKFGQGREVTCMVDLTRDAHGQVRARLLDLVLGRSGPAYSGWLDARRPEFRAHIKSAALDPFRGYANALRDSLSDAVQVLDAFHVVKLGTQVVDEVRRRVQQEQFGRRGHKHDPLYKIRGLLRHGLEHLSERQHARLQAGLIAGDPNCEVELAWSCYQQLRAIYAGTASLRERRTLAEKVIASFPTCPIPEVARLGRTLRAWRSQVLAYFDTDGLSNGGTEAINMLIEKARRLAHGYRNFDNYRLRMLLAASGTRTRRVRTQGP
jgi:transposase